MLKRFIFIGFLLSLVFIMGAGFDGPDWSIIKNKPNLALQLTPTQIGKILEAEDAAGNDYFGYSVALGSGGTVLVVGAFGWENAGSGRGGVYIYDWSGSVWVQRGAVLEAGDAADSDSFGSSVCINYSGTVLIVGAYMWEGATGSNRGGVYIYDWSGSTWVQRGNVLEAGDAEDNDWFGNSVSLNDSGTVLAVGASGWDHTGTDGKGCVYIYDWSGSVWVQRGSVLEAGDAADSDAFGTSLAMNSSSTILIVGATTWEGSTGSNIGGAYIYDWIGSAWVQRGAVLEAGDASTNDYYGRSVSLDASGTVLAVGACFWEGAVGSNRGGVYIYDWNGSAWVQRGNVLETGDAADNDTFGTAVSLNASGTMLTVGANNWEGGTGSNLGGVYTYALDKPIQVSIDRKAEMDFSNVQNKFVARTNIGLAGAVTTDSTYLEKITSCGRVNVPKNAIGSGTWNVISTIDSGIYAVRSLGRGIILAGTNPSGNISRSVDYGATWVDSGKLFGLTMIVEFTDLGSGTVLAYGGNNCSVLRSTDYGLNWSNLGALDAGATAYPGKSAYLGNGVVILGTGNISKLFRSTDYGLTWTSIVIDSSQVAVSSVVSLGNGVALAGTNVGGKIYKSTDYGLTWDYRYATGNNIQNLVYLGNGIVIAGEYATGFMARSTDYGTSWTHLGVFFSQLIYSFSYVGDGVVLAGTSPAGKILRSTDYGLTWADIGVSGIASHVYSLTYAGNGVVVAGAKGNNAGKILRCVTPVDPLMEEFTSWLSTPSRRVSIATTTDDGVTALQVNGSGTIKCLWLPGNDTTGPILVIGSGTPATSNFGIQFGNDTSARLYRGVAGTVYASTGFAAANLFGTSYLQTPLIYPTGSTDLIIQTRAGDTNHAILFKSSGVERMRIAATGSVLIGTTTEDLVNAFIVNGLASVTSLSVTATTTTRSNLNIYSREESILSNLTPATPDWTSTSWSCSSIAIILARRFNLDSVPATFTSYTQGCAAVSTDAAFDGAVLAPNGKIILIPAVHHYVGIYDPVLNTYTQGPIATTTNFAFVGGALAPNGKIIMTPYQNTCVGIYDPIANTYTQGPVAHSIAGAFMGGILAPNGKVIFLTSNSDYIGVYDPVANTYTQGPAAAALNDSFIGGCLAPNGKIILSPYNSDYVGIYDPIANTYTQGCLATTTNSAFRCSVLAPNGKVILIPYGTPYVGIYDPIANTYTQGCLASTTSVGYYGGALAPNGKIVICPYDGDYVGLYDPIANTFCQIAGAVTGNAAFASAITAPNGKVILIPLYSNYMGIYDPLTGPIATASCLAPWVNKM